MEMHADIDTACNTTRRLGVAACIVKTVYAAAPLARPQPPVAGNAVFEVDGGQPAHAVLHILAGYDLLRIQKGRQGCPC